jgi:hypothetical protein
LSAFGTLRHSSQGTIFGRSWGKSGQTSILARDGYDVNDPKRTLGVHLGNDFDADFSPCQCTRLLACLFAFNKRNENPIQNRDRNACGDNLRPIDVALRHGFLLSIARVDVA